MIYYDFDGTLKVWDKTQSLESVGKGDYPIKQAWIEPMRYAASKIIKRYPGQVTVFTAVLNPETEKSKRTVIEEAFGKDVANQMVTTCYNGNKSEAIPKKGKRIAIKVLNGINGTKGTWDGYVVSAIAENEICFKQLAALLEMILSEDPDADILIDDFTENLYAWEGRERRSA